MGRGTQNPHKTVIIARAKPFARTSELLQNRYLVIAGAIVHTMQMARVKNLR